MNAQMEVSLAADALLVGSLARKNRLSNLVSCPNLAEKLG